MLFENDITTMSTRCDSVSVLALLFVYVSVSPYVSSSPFLCLSLFPSLSLRCSPAADRTYENLTKGWQIVKALAHCFQLLFFLGCSGVAIPMGHWGTCPSSSF